MKRCPLCREESKSTGITSTTEDKGETQQARNSKEGGCSHRAKARKYSWLALSPANTVAPQAGR